MEKRFFITKCFYILLTLFLINSGLSYTESIDQQYELMPTKQKKCFKMYDVFKFIEKHPFLTSTLVWLSLYGKYIPDCINEFHCYCKRHPFISIFITGFLLRFITKRLVVDENEESDDVTITVDA